MLLSILSICFPFLDLDPQLCWSDLSIQLCLSIHISVLLSIHLLVGLSVSPFICLPICNTVFFGLAHHFFLFLFWIKLVMDTIFWGKFLFVPEMGGTLCEVHCAFLAENQYLQICRFTNLSAHLPKISSDDINVWVKVTVKDF